MRNSEERGGRTNRLNSINFHSSLISAKYNLEQVKTIFALFCNKFCDIRFLVFLSNLNPYWRVKNINLQRAGQCKKINIKHTDTIATTQLNSTQSWVGLIFLRNQNQNQNHTTPNRPSLFLSS